MKYRFLLHLPLLLLAVGASADGTDRLSQQVTVYAVIFYSKHPIDFRWVV
jgi:hypothetical protein